MADKRFRDLAYTCLEIVFTIKDGFRNLRSVVRSVLGIKEKPKNLPEAEARLPPKETANLMGIVDPRLSYKIQILMIKNHNLYNINESLKTWQDKDIELFNEMINSIEMTAFMQGIESASKN